MIIFGWGKEKATNLGPVAKFLCSNCRNEDFWELQKVSNYVSLYFIPVFPYKTKHYLVCPVCGAYREVDGDELVRFRAMAKENLARIGRAP